MTNPFDAKADADRHFIWDRLIVADTEAFVAHDWSVIAGDFAVDRFEGVRCNHSADPKAWTIAFPRLDDYKKSWLAASREFLMKAFRDCTHREAIYRRCRIRRIDLAGDRALAFKEFSGDVPLADGTTLSGDRLTIYRLHHIHGRWKVVGFLGQLPLPEHL
jgi:hypothetical protein